MKTLATVVFLLLSSTVYADTFYDVTGKLTVNGPSASETVNFAFTVDQFSEGPTNPSVAFVPKITSFSDVGPLTVTSAVSAPNMPNPNFSWVAFEDGRGDEIDLWYIPGATPDTPPTFTGDSIFACSSSGCVSSFGNESNSGGFDSGPIQVNVGPGHATIETPEPPILALLGFGGLALAACSLVLRKEKNPN